MSTLKTIGNKLFKEDLSSHKVTLANINDFNKTLNDAKVKLKNFDDNFDQLEKSIKPVIDSGDLYLKSLEEVTKINDELAAKFKEIGLDWNGTPEFKAFRDLIVKGKSGVISTMIARVKNI